MNWYYFILQYCRQSALKLFAVLKWFPLEALEQISRKIIKSAEQMSVVRKFEGKW
jgi:hypothetical protein